MSNYEEGTTVELKREINKDFKKEIIAFANTNGGDIYIGIEKNGNIFGVRDAENVMAQVGNMIRDGIKPDLGAYTSIDSFSDNNKKIIHVSVLRGTKRPYHLTEKGLKPSGVFIRHGVSSVPATDEAIREMLRESDGEIFDKSRSATQELTFVYTGEYFKANNLGFSEQNQRSLGLIDSDGYYTNAALLLADQCECNIKCAVYTGTGKTYFKSRREFGGSILEQADEALEFIKLNNNLNSTFEGLRRIDHPDYPEYALREALLNSIIHRDYDYSGSIIINIYDNRIEFVSLGGLVKGITMKDIMHGVSQPRNSVIASVFYRLELVEAYGTGIQRILEGYKDNLAKPIFKSAPASFVVILPKLIDNEILYVNDSHSRENFVMKAIKENGSIGRKDIELLLGISKFTAIQILNKLLEEGKITKTGSARSVTYRLCK